MLRHDRSLSYTHIIWGGITLTSVRVCVQENLDKQTQYAKTLSEKLWLAERKLEELEVDKDTKGKKTSELHSTILRLETEVQRQILLI